MALNVSSVFPAAVTGELTGNPGVVLTGVGPGAASAVNGIAYAYLERAPVLLLRDGPASSTHRAIDHSALFAPITKIQGRLRPTDGRCDVEAALRTALMPPWGPVHLDLTAEDAEALVTGPALPTSEPSPALPDPDALHEARGLLSAGRRPAVIAGLHARHGTAPMALARLADVLRCPIYPTYKAKGVLPDAHSCTVGLFTGAAAEADCLEQADLIVLFGFDPVEMIPGAWRYEAPILVLDPVDGLQMAGNVQCRVIGDLATIMDELLPLTVGSTWTETQIDGFRQDMRRRLTVGGKGHTAQSVVEALNDRAPDGCRVAVDAGAHMFSAMAFLDANRPSAVLKSNGLSTMGYAVPAAIAAALEYPERTAVAVTGDGGLMMSLAELTTAVDLGCKLLVLVLNDAALSLIDIKQERQHRPSSGVRYERVDFAAAATALGCCAGQVGPGDPLAPALDTAFEAGRPALIDITIDPSGYGEQLIALRG